MIGAVATGFALQGILVDVSANQPLVLAAIAGFVLLVAAIAAVCARSARCPPRIP